MPYYTSALTETPAERASHNLVRLVQNPCVAKRMDVFCNGEYSGAIWRGTADSDSLWTAWLPCKAGISRQRVTEGLRGFKTRKAAIEHIRLYGWWLAD